MALKRIAAALMAALISTASFAATDKAEFVKKATEAGNFEIMSSELAVEKAKSPEVKEFAQQMIDDHTAAAKKLEAAASEAGIAPEQERPQKTSQHMKDMEKLQQAKANKFDATYVDIQRKAHEQAVKLFQSYAENGDDPKLKEYAAETLPTLKSHLKHVKELSKKRAAGIGGHSKRAIEAVRR